MTFCETFFCFTGLEPSRILNIYGNEIPNWWVGIQQFLKSAERGLSSLTKESSKELITATMAEEGTGLNDFMWSVVLAADKILDTGLLSQLVPESCYYGPPCAKPETRLRPNEEYFKQAFQRRGSKELREHAGFRWDLVLPHDGQNAGLQLEGAVQLPYPPGGQTKFELRFEVNYDDTLTAFKWLMREWRRPLGQMLRGLPSLELRGNGMDIDPPKEHRTKDVITRLEYYLAQPENPGCGSNLFSLELSFCADETDEEVVVTCAVFLSLFDAVYRLTCDRVDPDRLLRHYQTLVSQIPKAPFRATSIFPQEPARAQSNKREAMESK